MRLIQVILFGIFLCTSSIGNSQNLPSKNITVNDGLPSNTIRSVYKDSRGMLWIGTEAGLCCYNGINYKVFNETDGLKYNNIWSIVEDEDSNLWLSIYGKGLAKYDGKQFTYYDKHNGLVNDNIRRLYYSKKYKCLIIATENGLSLFDGKQFKSFTRKDTSHAFQIVSVNETRDKILVTSSYFGVYNLSINKDISKSTIDSLFQTETLYSSFVFDSKYFIGEAASVLKVFSFSREHNHLDSVLSTLRCPIIWDYASDSSKNLYCATWDVTSPRGGLFKYRNGKMEDISRQVNVNSTALWCLYYDYQNQLLWVGSLDKGLFRINISNQITFLNSEYFGVKDLHPLELYNDKGNNTWIGAESYIIKLHPDLSYQIIDKNNLGNKVAAFLNKRHINLYSESVLSEKKIKDGFSPFNITEDHEGQIWVSTTCGFFRFNHKLEITSYHYSDGGGHVAFDNNDRLFFGLMYGNMFVAPDKTDMNLTYQFSAKNKFVPRDISKILGSGNHLWYGTYANGLFTSIDTNFYQVSSSSSFGELYIKDFIFDHEQNIVIGTNTGRVYVAKPKGSTIEILKVYYPERELYGSSIIFLEECKGAYIVGTNKGINVIERDTCVKLLNQPEGLFDLQFNAGVKDKDENLFVSTDNGLLKILLNEFTKVKEVSATSININSVKVNQQNYSVVDTSIRWGSFNGNSLLLGYKQNDIEVFFSVNNIFNAVKDVYRYKVVGLTDNWSQYESGGHITLKGIPSGNYTLVIEGKNMGSGEVIPTKNLAIIITPPFWETTWFILVSLGLIASILLVLYKLRIRAVRIEEKGKAELTNKLLEARLEALRAQMNPHFTFNAINSIQNFIIDKNTELALHYLSEFSKLIRQTLENSTQKLIPLHTEIDFLESYISIQKIRFETVQTFIVIDNSIDLYNTQVPPLIIQPFIENAFEHAFERQDTSNKIEINFTVRDQQLICTVEDNGIGFSTESLNPNHQSKGLQLTIDRLNLLNKEYKSNKFTLVIANLIKSDTNKKGTLATLTFPVIAKKHYS